VFRVPVNGVTSTQDVCDKLPVTSAQSSCPNFYSAIDCLQHDLVSPSRVTAINAEKRRHELYFHPGQTQVDYVISGLSNGFHLDKLPSSPQARHRTSFYLPEWHSSLQVSAVFLSSNYPTISSYPWKVLPEKAFPTISLRLWGVGLAKFTCYMCVLQWKPSFLSQEDLFSRYELLYPSFGPLFWVLSDLGISLWSFGFPGHEPPFLQAMPSLLGGPAA